MEAHGMIVSPQSSSQALVATGYSMSDAKELLKKIMKYHYETVVNSVKRMIGIRNAGEAENEEEEEVPRNKNERRKYGEYLNFFTPSRCGGTLEARMIVWDKETSALVFAKEIADDDMRGEPDSIEEWMEPINNTSTFCLMPGTLVISGKMLIDLVRWPPVLGASNKSIQNLMFYLNVRRQLPLLLATSLLVFVCVCVRALSVCVCRFRKRFLGMMYSMKCTKCGPRVLQRIR
jgi:hypothetical protein